MAEAAVQVIVADHQTVARMGTCRILRAAHGIDVVAEAGSGKEALRLAREVKPDVLVTEMNLPDLSGIQLAVRLAETPVQFLAFTAYEDERYIRHLLENGIAGYLKKDDAVHFLVEAVRALARGEEDWVSPQIARAVLRLNQKQDGATLLEACDITSREREVLDLMGQGFSNQQIADELFIAKNTVRTHVSRVYDKLDVHSREQAMAWAWEHGLTGKK